MANFTVIYDMKERGLSTLFKSKIFTIFKEDRSNWDYNNLDQYLINYELTLSPEILHKYRDDHDVKMILDEMVIEPCFFKIDNNKADRYNGEKQYIRCTIPLFILSSFKKLFISTVVHHAEKVQIPENEFIKFEFNSVQKTVSISDIKLYRPMDNPFFKFARNAASSLSVEAIGLEQFSVDNVKDVKNFYDSRQFSGWKEKDYIHKEKGIDDKSGVYMLYDSENNTFYIGKGNKLKDRIIQHIKNVNGNGPIHNFTHYRYSVISGEYYEFLYLIENAAIHDAAWILDMAATGRYTPSLGTIVKRSGKSLDDCVMVNDRDFQTRNNK